MVTEKPETWKISFDVIWYNETNPKYNYDYAEPVFFQYWFCHKIVSLQDTVFLWISFVWLYRLDFEGSEGENRANFGVKMGLFFLQGGIFLIWLVEGVTCNADLRLPVDILRQILYYWIKNDGKKYWVQYYFLEFYASCFLVNDYINIPSKYRIVLLI